RGVRGQDVLDPFRAARHGLRQEGVGQTSAATATVNSGATISAGSMSPTGTDLRLSSRIPTPSRRTPPVAVRAANIAADITSPTSTAMTVNSPCQTPTDSAEAATPHPKEAAKAIDAKPSNVAFSANSSMP